MILPKPTKRVKVTPPLRRSSPPKRTKRPRKARKSTAGQKARTADRLFSLIVRHPAKCAYHSAAFECTGPLQCAHIVSRRYRGVRWTEGNAMPLCAAAHMKFTHDPLAWEDFVTRCGYNLLALKMFAQQPWDHDIDGVLVRLAARAVALGIKPEGK